MPDDVTEAYVELTALWSGERDEVELRFDEQALIWEVYLSATFESDLPHDAEWATYTWVFPHDTPAAALADALTWCRALEALRRCDTCGGRGGYVSSVDGEVLCDQCGGSGLAHGRPEWTAVMERTTTPDGYHWECPECHHGPHNSHAHAHDCQVAIRTGAQREPQSQEAG